MALGDVYNSISASVANDAYLTIQPSAGVEASIHNIYVPESSGVEIYYSDGVNDVLVVSNTGSLYSTQFHVTNTYYIRVKNVSGSSINLGYDGIVTKAT